MNSIFFKNFFSARASVSVFHQKKAQATLEFSFAMIVALMLLIGMIQIFIWAGKDLADRSKAHEDVLTDMSAHGLSQTKPIFYYSSPISATFDSSLNP